LPAVQYAPKGCDCTEGVPDFRARGVRNSAAGAEIDAPEVANPEAIA
jgi:hypothetical protein